MWPFNQNNQQMYEQYAQNYDNGNFNFMDPSQALGQLGSFIQGAPPDLQQTVFQEHFARLPFEHRQFIAQQLPPQYGVDPNDPYSLAQGVTRFGQERPSELQRLLQHPILLTGAVALTALAAKHIIAHHRHQQQYAGQPYQPYGNQPYGGGQSYGGGQPYGQPYGGGQAYGGGGGDPYLQRELNEERREDRELRRELREEERIVREEEGERHHHRRDDYY